MCFFGNHSGHAWVAPGRWRSPLAECETGLLKETFTLTHTYAEKTSSCSKKEKKKSALAFHYQLPMDHNRQDMKQGGDEHREHGSGSDLGL